MAREASILRLTPTNSSPPPARQRPLHPPSPGLPCPPHPPLRLGLARVAHQRAGGGGPRLRPRHRLQVAPPLPATAWPACPTSPAAAARPLFPPEDRHKVLVLATTQPADLGVPTSHWSLEDLAYRILKDAHYRDMSRSTVQRILAEADLKPHKSRYWLHSDDPDFEAKAVAICRLYLDAPRLYQQGELVVCVDEKTGIQALERLHPTKPARSGRVALQEFEYLRHGTRCLLASLVVPTGQVLGCHRTAGDLGLRAARA